MIVLLPGDVTDRDFDLSIAAAFYIRSKMSERFTCDRLPSSSTL